MDEITNSDDIIDSRNVITRLKELKKIKGKDDYEKEEIKSLQRLQIVLEEAGFNNVKTDENCGVTLISDDYFDGDFAESEAESCGFMDRKNEGMWPYNHLDWDAAAEQLKDDYTEIEWDGNTYYARG